MSKSSSFKTGYGIGYYIGYALAFVIKGFFKLMWTGIYKASVNNKYVSIAYLVELALFFMFGYLYNDYSNITMLIIITATVMAIWYKIDEKPVKDRIKYFYHVFDKVGLKSPQDEIPYYLSETEISDYITAFSFNTVIPLNIWFSKRDTLEMYLDVKIIDIRKDEENHRIIHLMTQTKPLPSYIEWSDRFINDNNILSMGIDYYGVIGMDLEKYPHAFIAGETGSGKSNLLKCLIHQALIKDYDVVLIDFKRGVSFSSFKYQVKIYYEYESIMNVLKEMVILTNERLDKLRNAGVENINDYNRLTNDYLYRKIVFIDELAELLKTRDKEIATILNDCIETLTRLSRTVGIHLIMGLQRVDSTIINGQIKNNVSYRVCGRFVDKEPSRIMLGSDKASSLPNIKGRFIVKDDNLYEIQSFYYNSDYYIERVQKPLYNQNREDRTEINNSYDDIQEEPIQEEKPKTENEIDFDFSEFKK